MPHQKKQWKSWYSCHYFQNVIASLGTLCSYVTHVVMSALGSLHAVANSHPENSDRMSCTDKKQHFQGPATIWTSVRNLILLRIALPVSFHACLGLGGAETTVRFDRIVWVCCPPRCSYRTSCLEQPPMCPWLQGPELCEAKLFPGRALVCGPKSKATAGPCSSSYWFCDFRKAWVSSCINQGQL